MADSEDTIKFSLKRIGAIAALVGALVGGVISMAGWYGSEIEQDTQAEIQRLGTIKRIDGLEEEVDRHEKAMQLDTIRGIRTETMLETLLEEKQLPVPPKTKQQRDIEDKLLSGSN